MNDFEAAVGAASLVRIQVTSINSLTVNVFHRTYIVSA